MQQHSSNNSSQSNLFALSSQSSRGELRKSHKHNYSSFVKKVKHLLQVEGDDLDDLYRKVEIIVKKYFDEHKIVEFGDMYNHIRALKSNSSKMTHIISILQKQLLPHQNLKRSTAQSRKTSKHDQITVSTQKDTINSRHHGSQTHNNKQSRESNTFSESRGTVVNSIKYNHIYRPSFQKTQDITINQRKEDSLQKSYSKRTESPASYKQLSPSEHRQSSPGINSREKLNSSFQQYQNRNKKYQDKVRQLMEEVKVIKGSLQHQYTKQKQSQNFRKQAKKEELKQSLKININQNYIYLPQTKSQQSLIDNCLQKNIMSDTNQTQSVETHNNYAKTTLQRIIQQDKQIGSNKTIGGSNKTIGSIKRIKNTSIQALETNIPIKTQEIYPLSKALEVHPSVKAVQNHTPVKTLEQYQSIEDKKILLLKQAQNITKQLKQLKQVASQLQIDPSSNTISSGGQSQSQGSIILRSNTHIISNIQRNNQLILQKISDTTSKPLIESLLPSFKRIQQKTINLKNSVQSASKQSFKMIESSAFSFSDNTPNHRYIQSSHFPQIGNQPLENNRNMQSHSFNPSIEPNHSAAYISQQNPFPSQISTVKYIYNPYQNSKISFQTSNVPNLSSNSSQNRSIINTSYMHSPNISHNSSTSIMHHPIKNDIKPANRSSLQKPTANDNHRYLRERQNNQYEINQNRQNHMIAIHNPRSHSRYEESIVGPVPYYQNPNITQMQNSSSAFKKKGITILSPPPRQIFES